MLYLWLGLVGKFNDEPGLSNLARDGGQCSWSVHCIMKLCHMSPIHAATISFDMVPISVVI